MSKLYQPPFQKKIPLYVPSISFVSFAEFLLPISTMNLTWKYFAVLYLWFILIIVKSHFRFTSSFFCVCFICVLCRNWIITICDSMCWFYMCVVYEFPSIHSLLCPIFYSLFLGLRLFYLVAFLSLPVYIFFGVCAVGICCAMHLIHAVREIRIPFGIVNEDESEYSVMQKQTTHIHIHIHTTLYICAYKYYSTKYKIIKSIRYDDHGRCSRLCNCA